MIFKHDNWQVLNTLALRISYKEFKKSLRLNLSADENILNFNEIVIEDFWQNIISNCNDIVLITNDAKKNLENKKSQFHDIGNYTGIICFKERKAAPLSNITMLISINKIRNETFFSFGVLTDPCCIFIGFIAGRITKQGVDVYLNYGPNKQQLQTNFEFCCRAIKKIQNGNLEYCLTPKNPVALKVENERYINYLNLPIKILDNRFLNTQPAVSNESTYKQRYTRLLWYDLYHDSIMTQCKNK